MDFKYAQSWLLGIVCFVYGIYRVIGGSDESFNWVDAAAIFGFFICATTDTPEAQYLPSFLAPSILDLKFFCLLYTSPRPRD